MNAESGCSVRVTTENQQKEGRKGCIYNKNKYRIFSHSKEVPGGLSEIEPISDVANRDNKELCRRFSGLQRWKLKQLEARACTRSTGDCPIFLKVVRGNRVGVPLIGKSQKWRKNFNCKITLQVMPGTNSTSRKRKRDNSKDVFPT